MRLPFPAAGTWKGRRGGRPAARHTGNGAGSETAFFIDTDKKHIYDQQSGIDEPVFFKRRLVADDSNYSHEEKHSRKNLRWCQHFYGAGSLFIQKRKRFFPEMR